MNTGDRKTAQLDSESSAAIQLKHDPSRILGLTSCRKLDFSVLNWRDMHVTWRGSGESRVRRSRADREDRITHTARSDVIIFSKNAHLNSVDPHHRRCQKHLFRRVADRRVLNWPRMAARRTRPSVEEKEMTSRIMGFKGHSQSHVPVIDVPSCEIE